MSVVPNIGAFLLVAAAAAAAAQLPTGSGQAIGNQYMLSYIIAWWNYWPVLSLPLSLLW